MSEQRIVGVVPSGRTTKFVNLFGYTSHGIPGIDIVGLSGNARTLKEKLIFLTRQQDLQINLRRFVLGVDPVSKIEGKDDLKWLELPLLILYWSLLEWIPLKSLENCFSSGRVYPSGAIIPFCPNLETCRVVATEGEAKIWITSKWHQTPEGFFHLPLEDLLYSRQKVHIPEKSQIERAFARSI